MKTSSLKFFLFIYFSSFVGYSQIKEKLQTKISEYYKELKTYDFNDPNPIPILLSNPKIYPYFTFDGYEINAKNKLFKIVELENDYIKVFVAPELGGKVWGAIEKSSGKEFIYKNEVVKFRNISMRGPWTSGGIEFNFGIIGHHPSTATPVDYIIQKNDDGSISCTVGNIDLPSRTQWRVKIMLKEGKASFNTDALWYNPSPIKQSYYNWMTAAAPARYDLEFYAPGNAYLEHNGKMKSWPIDPQGRNLSKYNQNNFGPSKSYHIVGEYNDFFGGYYTKDQYGYGHWGNYEDIPGQKLWLWSQARSGEIWEDLLTDSDGQYIEFQAGRLFVQFSPNEEENPISNVSFEPYRTDQWKEVWFPIKEIGGLKEASEFGAMNIEKNDDSLIVKLNPFIKIKSDLKVIVENKLYHNEKIDLNPMDIFVSKIAIEKSKDFEIIIEELDLHFISDNNQIKISRLFATDEKIKVMNTTEKLYQEAKENISYREYQKAEDELNEIISKDPYHLQARIELGELFFRKGEYDKGLEVVNEGLSIDTYNASLNYIAGIIYKVKNDNINAKEALGWASRSTKYRSNALSQIGDIYLKEKKYSKAISYAKKALNYDINNIPALEIIAIGHRKVSNKEGHKTIINRIKNIDPIHHIISFEKYLINSNDKNREAVIRSHKSELSYQTYLELAINYYNRGLIEEAIILLNIGPNVTINKIWESFLKKDKKALKKVIESSSINFVFPFRRETIKVMEWAESITSEWKTTYYLALNLWGKDRFHEAEEKFLGLMNYPDESIFYLTRGLFLKKIRNKDPYKDLIKAYELDPYNWRIAKEITNYYISKAKNNEAYKIIKKTYEKNKSNYIIGMDYVKTLNILKKYNIAIDLLDSLKILPYEHAGEGRDLYTKAYFGASINYINKSNFKKAISLLKKSKEWPENLGVGKPYNTDERIQDYLLYYCYYKLKKDEEAENYLKIIINYSRKNINKKTFLNVIGLEAIRKIEGNESSNKYLKKLLESDHGLSRETKWISNYFKTNNITNQDLNHDLLYTLLHLK